jgi:periplasmic protein TonB
VSDSGAAAPILVLPADLPWSLRQTKEPLGWREAIAVAAAALLHTAIILWFLWDWWPSTMLAHEPEAISVTLVFASPPPPPATEVVPLPPPPPPLIGAESGKDEQTTAPPQAEAVGPETTKPPAAPAAPPVREQKVPEPSKTKPRKEVARVDPRKEAETARAAHLEPPRRITVAPGEREQTGDPYLNRARDLLEMHRIYPKVLGQFGLPVEGTPVYEIMVDRGGDLRAMKLVQSSGATGLDEAGEKMIRSTAPFPPLPANYCGEAVVMTVTIHLFPDRP